MVAIGNRSGQLKRQTALFLPLLAGFCIRFHDLGRQALFLDEAFSADLVLRPWKEMISLGFQDVHPLLFYSLLKPVVSCLPVTELTLRLIPAVCSTLALALAIGIARRLAGFRVAAWVGWMLTWSSLHLYYAQEARMYSLLELLWLLSPWLLLKALDSSAWLPWIGWALATGAAAHTHFYGLLLWGVGALGSGVVILIRRSRRELGRWLGAQFIVAVVTLPLIILIVSTVRRGVGGTWVPSWKDPLSLWLLALFGFSPVRFHFLYGGLLSLAPWNSLSYATWAMLAFFATGGAVIGWLYLRRHRVDRWSGWLVFTFGLLPPLLAALILGFTRQRLWAYRPFMGTATWLFIGLAIGWSAFPRRIFWAVLGLLFVLNLGSLWAYETQWVKDYSREALHTWATEVPDGTTLVLDRYYTSLVWNFYRPTQTKTLVFGITPRSDGSFGLRRVMSDGTLRGHSEVATCDDLPIQNPISLYDPGGRRFREGVRWPSCLQERPGWLFNPQTGHWEKASQLLP